MSPFRAALAAELLDRALGALGGLGEGLGMQVAERLAAEVGQDQHHHPRAVAQRAQQQVRPGEQLAQGFAEAGSNWSWLFGPMRSRAGC